MGKNENAQMYHLQLWSRELSYRWEHAPNISSLTIHEAFLPVMIWHSGQNNDYALIKFLVSICSTVTVGSGSPENPFNAALDEEWLLSFHSSLSVIIITATRSPNCSSLEQHLPCLQAASLSICGERTEEFLSYWIRRLSSRSTLLSGILTLAEHWELYIT